MPRLWGSAARCGLPEKAPWLSCRRAGGLFPTLELHVRTVRCALNLTLSAVCRPPRVSGGSADAELSAGWCVGAGAVRTAEYPDPHVEAMANVVARGFSAHLILAIGA